MTEQKHRAFVDLCTALRGLGATEVQDSASGLSARFAGPVRTPEPAGRLQKGRMAPSKAELDAQMKAERERELARV